MSLETMPDTGVDTHASTQEPSGGSREPESREGGVEGQPGTEGDKTPLKIEGVEVVEPKVEDKTTDKQTPDPNADAASRLADLERQIAERDALLSQIAMRMNADPELARRLDGEPEEVDSAKLVTQAVQAIRDGLEPKGAEVLIKALTPLFERQAVLEKQVNGLRPAVDEMSRSIGNADFRNALSTKLPRETVESKQFAQFVAGLRGPGRYQRVMQGDQAVAGEFAANAWIASRARQGSWPSDKARVEAAKNGREGPAARRSTSVAKQVYKITRQHDGSHVDKAFQVRQEWAKSGKEGLPDIEFVDPKTS